MYFPKKVVLGPEVTFGMSACGNSQTTREALAALFSSVTGDYQLMLVDDCSPDDTKAVFLNAKSAHSNTLVFHFDSNKEYSGSLNAILSHSTGAFTIFVSNDILITPSYVRELLGVAKQDDRNGIVRGCSNFVDNNLATHNVAFPGSLTVWRKLAEFADDLAARNNGRSVPDPFLVGDAFLVRREVIDRIGTLDPFFFGYFADTDYGIRARIAGFNLVLAHGAYAYHKRDANLDYLPANLRQEKLYRRWERVYENWARFKIKYGLPVDLRRPDGDKFEWDRFCEAQYDAARHHVPSQDYAQYRL